MIKKLIILFVLSPMANAETIWDTWLNVQQGNTTSNTGSFSNALGEKPCLGYGGCSGTGISSGRGQYYGLAEYGSARYQIPYHVESYEGYWTLGNNRIPYDDSSRTLNQKYDYLQSNWFNQFFFSPAATRR